MNIRFLAASEDLDQALILGVWEGRPHPVPDMEFVQEYAAGIDAFLKQQFSRDLFSGKAGESAVLPLWTQTGLRNIVFVGLGLPQELSPLRCEIIGGSVAGQLGELFEAHAIVEAGLTDIPGLPDHVMAAHLAIGMQLRNYRYDKWKTPVSKPRSGVLKSVSIVAVGAEEASELYRHHASLVDGISLARDLVNEPPNTLNPATFSSAIEHLRDDGVNIREVSEDELEELGLSAILAVGRSSPARPRLLLLQWQGAHPDEPPVALVGKGITFDTGGLCLKPAEHMKLMKGDMAGAASVAGAIYALARGKVAVNAIGILALAENSVSGDAYRPTDVIRTARGDTIEICHTDAEGRLALLDALWYASQYCKPRAVLSIGTLGGSGLFGLGLKYGALYCENEEMLRDVMESADTSGDLLWRLPVYDEMQEELKASDVADYVQMPDFFTYGADSGYVYQLLKPSVTTDSWAHIEMCRLEFALKDGPTCPRGATGYGVRLLAEYSSRRGG
ncbi:leucyl aminopeptidase family protein [Haliea sp. E1-2-M8]|uniref:leucyl aminopeptidase family protein n=1 Tax=Haliea sp. E1-2-M8 TaxID=3064706 RepID=UPI0027268D28|nr:leucyl aminopeptidase family protein [Haliea sp. E1-2-M8]MDO8862000.1 leucyl aminopeptidase family protein [Haliea sp. E1-2-M8]